MSVAPRYLLNDGEHIMANPEMPFLDIDQLLQQIKVPGVDINALLEARRKDIEALVTANRTAYEGMQSLGQRQAEMLREAMAEWQAAATQMMSGQNPSAGMAEQAELGKKALERTLANMRELAEIATTSQKAAWAVVNQRFQDNLAELKRLMQPK
jgi:phasin family protein